MSSRLLVTGAAGFIGANFVHYWRRSQPKSQIIILDVLTYAGNLLNIETLLEEDSNVRFVHGDILDSDGVEDLLRDWKIDTIVHFAAETHVDRSITGPDAFLATNVIGTHSLLKAARKIWLDEKRIDGRVRFHHVSTDEVFGSLGFGDCTFREDTPYAPNSPYAASKAASDHLVRAYYKTFGLPAITTNCSNNYGPYQHPEKLIPLVLTNALDGRALPVYGDGLNVRDWLYVEDHCRGIETTLVAGRIGSCYNIGGRNEQANIDVVRLVCDLLDGMFARNPSLTERFPKSPAANGGKTEDLITFVADRLGHDRRYAIDATRIERELGFVPTESFATGLARTIDWYIKNETWWRAIMDGSYRDEASLRRYAQSNPVPKVLPR